MNSDEIVDIKRSWDIPMQNPTESGMAILSTFFTKYPHNLQKFDGFRDTPLEELPTNPRFKAHASRIIRVFDESIQSLGCDWSGAQLEEIWSKIGQSHFKRQISKQSFNELKECIFEVLTAACNLNESQSAAWLKLMDTVYGIIFKTMEKLDAGDQ